MARRKIKYFAVKVGRVPGVYLSWKECQDQIENFPGAIWSKFICPRKAERFISGYQSCTSSTSTDDLEVLVMSAGPNEDRKSIDATGSKDVEVKSFVTGSVKQPIFVDDHCSPDGDTTLVALAEPFSPLSSPITSTPMNDDNITTRKNKGKVSVKIRNPQYPRQPAKMLSTRAISCQRDSDNSCNDDDDELQFIENPQKEEYLNRTQSEEFFKVGSSEKEVAVGIFWDIENISIPNKVHPATFVTRIRELFANDNSPYCEKNFYVVCDVWRESKFIINQLHEFHVRIVHVPGIKQNTSDNVIRDLMNEFVNYNKYSRIVLISGDSDFSHDIHNFRRNRKCECIVIHNEHAKESYKKSANSAYLYREFISEYLPTAATQIGKAKYKARKKRSVGEVNDTDIGVETKKKRRYYRYQKKQMMTPKNKRRSSFWKGY